MDQAQDNFTDPESPSTKTAYGCQQRYNAQAAVDEDSHSIVVTTLNNGPVVVQQLLPVIAATQRNAGQPQR